MFDEDTPNLIRFAFVLFSMLVVIILVSIGINIGKTLAKEENQLLTINNNININESLYLEQCENGDETISLHYWKESSYSPERLYCVKTICTIDNFCKSINLDFINVDYWSKLK